MFVESSKRVVLIQIQESDQVVLESIKSPGQFLHSSAPYQLDHFISSGCVTLEKKDRRDGTPRTFGFVPENTESRSGQ